MTALGRYQLVRSVGRGGMAEVFEAVAAGEHGFERRVAIKRMRADLSSDASMNTLFLDEARTASALHHANLVAMLDYGVVDGAPFQVLEFIDGSDAEKLCDQGQRRQMPMPVEVALHLCAEIAHALDYVHTAKDARGNALGIVHRDVSPSNILVAWNGDVKLADFGIAWARSRVSETVAGVTRGKPSFMAPEQAVRGSIDGRTDVFALGCTLHALLTGSSPLSRDNALVDLLAGMPLVLDANIDDDVRSVITRATRGARHERFATAAEMATALRACLSTRACTDARGHTRQWLDALRDRPIAPARGALDALLGLEFVPMEQSSDRVFVTRPGTNAPGTNAPGTSFEAVLASESKTRSSVPASVLEATADQPVAEVVVPRPVRNRTVAMASIFATGALLVGTMILYASSQGSVATASRGTKAPQAHDGGVATSLGTSTHDAESLLHASRKPEHVADDVAREPDVRNVPSVPTATVIANVPTEQAPTVATPHASENPRRTGHGDGAVHTVIHAGAVVRIGTPVASTIAVPAVAASEHGSGVVAIGGDGAQRAEILVDGRHLGYAPRMITLDVGRHTLVLVRPDGSRLGPSDIDVASRYTSSSPFRMRFP